MCTHMFLWLQDDNISAMIAFSDSFSWSIDNEWSTHIEWIIENII
jgi:hypothetical protein